MLRLGMAAGVLAIAIVASSARADEWSKTYTTTGRADVRVRTDDGDVQITSFEQKQIAARVVTQGYKIGPSDVRVNESQSGDHVSIEINLPHMSWSWFGSRHRSVHIELRVPRDADLDAATKDGNVSAQGVSGRIRVHTGDGNITASGLRGDIRLHSGDGRIQGADLDGAVAADTGDGSITVRGRFDALELKSGDGSIDAAAAAGSKISSGWTLHTGDGRINLRLPDDFRADLEARTGDGHITLDFPVMVSGSLSRSAIQGKLNGGGGPLQITSGDGSIHVERL